ncbi:creatininase family protein [Sphingomonas sp. 35-24ZXX]|uniref:creatininase family protein n=1 Tax=Sphingomonas sp. 35-24ZXX TaxID=1545915 RepID=UPI0009DEF11C|nr:creatininase family protein [Sphingomonas sp. 35-24ZXX]
MKNAMLVSTAALFVAALAPSTVSAQSQKAPPDRTWITLPEANPLATPHKTKNYLPEMTWTEVAEFLKRSDMVIIPVGSIEQHGPQGPLGTDFLNGTEEAKLVAQYADVLVAPILMVGNSPYHLGFPGTISLSTETIQKVYVEAIESMIGQGFKRFLILNAHGGNQATTKFIVDRINQETPGIAVDLGEAIRPFMKQAAGTGPKPFDRHGGVNETSSSLYLQPGLVNLDAARRAKLKLPPHLEAMVPAVKAGDPTATLVFLAEALKQKSTGKGTATDDMTDIGVWSELDPATATAEQGRADSEKFVNAAVRFIEKWQALRPINVD